MTKREKLLRKALGACMRLVKEERDTMVECGSHLDKKTMRPIPGTLDEQMKPIVRRYDRAIALGVAALKLPRRRK